MKWALLSCTVIAATLPMSLAHAEKDDGDNIVILAVQPRSADVKPIAVSVSATGHDVGKIPVAQANTQISRR